jgi:hypothetical protein
MMKSRFVMLLRNASVLVRFSWVHLYQQVVGFLLIERRSFSENVDEFLGFGIKEGINQYSRWLNLVHLFDLSQYVEQLGARFILVFVEIVEHEPVVSV